MRVQAQLAIDAADVIVFVTDIRTGVVATDVEIASMLLKSGRPVILCVNKCDQVGEPPAEYYEFYNLGLGRPCDGFLCAWARDGRFIGPGGEFLPDEVEEDEEGELIRVAIIGKPNVGKSSLVNKVCGGISLYRVGYRRHNARCN